MISGTGNEIRSFIHIDDFVSGFDKIFRKGKNFQIYNIGTSEKIKIIDLAKLIASIFNKKIIIKKTKILKGSPTIRCPDIKKIKSIGFKQNVRLKDGLLKTIKQ
jgi:nucleoside-diphosphate-sugar epimerase